MNNLKKYQSVFVDIFNVPLEVLNDNLLLQILKIGILLLIWA